jgi:hypothetical protein
METKNQHDPVNNPSHYTSGNYQVIDFIEDKKLDYHLGNFVKYICRAGKKDPNKYKEDLQKAEWYLRRRLNNVWLPIEATLIGSKIDDNEFRDSQNLSPLIDECLDLVLLAIANFDLNKEIVGRLHLKSALELLNTEINQS